MDKRLPASKLLLPLTTLALALAINGCARITFVNGDQATEQPAMTEFNPFAKEQATAPAGVEVKSKWHHQLIYQVAEFSNTADTEKLCPDTEWNRMTTEVSAVPLLVGLLDNLLTTPAIDVWTPWDIEYSCKP